MRLPQPILEPWAAADRISVLRLGATVLAGMACVVAAWFVADEQYTVMAALLVVAVFAAVVAVERAILYVFPVAFILPNLGLDIPGPFAVLMWDAITVSFVGGTIVRRGLARRPIPDVDPWFRRLLILFVVAAFLSLTQTLSRPAELMMFGLKEFIRLIELSLFLFALAISLDTEEKVLVLARNLAIGGVAFTAVAIVAHFWFSDPFYRLVTLEKNYVLLGTYRMRMASTAGNAAESGMSFLLLFGVTSFFVGRGRPLGIRIAALLACAIHLAAIVLTLNKGTWQAIPLGLLVISLRSRTWRRFLLSAVLAAGLIAVVVLYRPELRGSVAVVAGDLASVSESSGAVRLQRWVSSVKVLRDDPLLGVGYNCFAFLYGEYAIRPGTAQYGHPHNLYVDVMTGTGLLGIALFLFWLWRIHRISGLNIDRAPTRRLRILSLHLHMVFWFFLAGNLTASYLFKPGHPAYLTITLVAMILAVSRLRIAGTRDPAA